MTCWAMTNRCDSVDALMYAYYEFMKIKEKNQMLEKNKNCIEFSMRSMMATHKPYQEDTEIAITGMAPGKSLLLANNPFDIPCDVVVVSKSYFEKLQADVNINAELAKQWEINYNLLLKKIGFDTVEELVNYLNSEAECDTLQEAISKLKDQVKYTCDEWYSANSSNNSWKAAAECNAPKELIEKIKGFRDEIGIYSRALQEWKEGTGCPSPSSAKTLIESGMAYEHGYHEAQKENRKLTEEVVSWKNVTGYSIPEGFLAAKINDLGNDYLSWKMVTGCSCPKDLSKKIVEWEKILTPHRSARDLCSAMSNAIEAYKSNIVKQLDATGCDTPDKAKERIKALNERIDESEADYNHLLMLTGFESEGEIEDALDKCDHSTLRKALVDYEFDYESLLKLTGYKSEQDIRVALNYSEQFVYETLRELINSLKRKAKFTESGWQAATGRSDPEAAKQYIDRLKGRLNKIHGYSVDW